VFASQIKKEKRKNMPNPITVVDVKKFFDCGTSHPVTLGEMTSFWKSLTEDEKNEYRASVEKWDGTSFYIN